MAAPSSTSLPSTAAHKVRRKVLLIGWDAADYTLLSWLVDRGDMPALAALTERGVVGRLNGLLPLVPSLLWTSIATGKRPDKHGVLLDTELDRRAGGLRLVSRSACTTARVWEMLHHHDIPTVVVNWPASHPATGQSGIVVSDGYSRLEPGWITPTRLEGVLADLRIHPRELGDEDLGAFVRDLDRTDRSDGRVALLAATLAESIAVHAAGTWLLEHEHWRFAAIRYAGLGALSDRFARYMSPRLPYVSAGDFEHFRDTLPAAYRFFDLMLARVVDFAGPDATIVLVSDRGIATGDLRPQTSPDDPQCRRAQGFLCLAGPGIRHDDIVHGASLLDVCPTVLRLFDLPIGVDMDGDALAAAWEEPPPSVTVPTWDALIDRPPLDAESPATSPEYDDALAALAANGYSDDSAAFLDRLATSMQRSAAGHLAVAHLHAGQYDAAARLLRELLDADPNNHVTRLYLAYCLCCLGELDDSRRLLEPIDDTSPAAREKALLCAILLLKQHRSYEALEYLQSAAQTRAKEPEVLCLLGRTLLQVRRYSEAENAFARALETDDECVSAHFGLALTYLRLQRWQDVVDRALTVVQLEHHHCAAHYALGVALFQLHRVERALQAFETALAIRPEWKVAETWVTNLRSGAIRPPLTDHVVEPA